MELQKTEKDLQNEKITVWDLMYIVKPIIADELIAKSRFDRTGIRIAFGNGQKFYLTINEIK